MNMNIEGSNLQSPFDYSSFFLNHKIGTKKIDEHLRRNDTIPFCQTGADNEKNENLTKATKPIQTKRYVRELRIVSRFSKMRPGRFLYKTRGVSNNLNKTSAKRPKAVKQTVNISAISPVEKQKSCDIKEVCLSLSNSNLLKVFRAYCHGKGPAAKRLNKEKPFDQEDCSKCADDNRQSTDRFDTTSTCGSKGEFLQKEDTIYSDNVMKIEDREEIFRSSKLKTVQESESTSNTVSDNASKSFNQIKTINGNSSDNLFMYEQSDYVKIDYKLVHDCLKYSSANEKCKLLDAIRSRITHSNLSALAEETVHDIVYFDLFGINCDCAKRSLLEDLFWPQNVTTPHPLQTSIARLLNALVSYQMGREYFNNKSIINNLTWGDPDRDNIEQDVADNLIAVMMKLSFNPFQSADMIKSGLLKWLLNHMEKVEHSASMYHLKCMTGLLRMLVNEDNSIDGSLIEVRKLILLLGRYLDIQNDIIKMNICAIMSTLFKKRRAVKTAKEIDFDKFIDEHIEKTLNSIEREHLKAVYQLLTHSGQYSTNDVESGNGLNEQELHLDDEMDDSVDFYPCESLLREKFSEKEKEPNSSLKLEDNSTDDQDELPLLSRIFIDGTLPKMEGNRICRMVNLRCLEDTEQTYIRFYDSKTKEKEPVQPVFLKKSHGTIMMQESQASIDDRKEKTHNVQQSVRDEFSHQSDGTGEEKLLNNNLQRPNGTIGLKEDMSSSREPKHTGLENNSSDSESNGSAVRISLANINSPLIESLVTSFIDEQFSRSIPDRELNEEHQKVTENRQRLHSNTNLETVTEESAGKTNEQNFDLYTKKPTVTHTGLENNTSNSGSNDLAVPLSLSNINPSLTENPVTTLIDDQFPRSISQTLQKEDNQTENKQKMQPTCNYTILDSEIDANPINNYERSSEACAEKHTRFESETPDNNSSCTASSDFTLNSNCSPSSISTDELDSNLKTTKEGLKYLLVDCKVDASIVEPNAMNAEKPSDEADVMNAEKPSVEADVMNAEKPLVEPAGMKAEKPSVEQDAMNAEKPSDEADAMNAENPSVEPDVMNAEKPSDEADAMNAEKPSDEADAMNAEKPPVEPDVMNAEKPSVEANVMNAEKPLVEPAGMNAEKPSVEGNAMNAEKPSDEADAMNAENPSVEPDVMNAEKPSDEADAMNAEKPSVEQDAMNAEKPSVEQDAMNAEKPSVEANAMNAEKPSEEADVMNAEKPSVEPDAMNAEKPLVEANPINDEKPSVESDAMNAEKPSTEENAINTENPSLEPDAMKVEKLSVEANAISAEKPLREPDAMNAEKPSVEVDHCSLPHSISELLNNEDAVDMLIEKLLAKMSNRNDFCGQNCYSTCGGLNKPKLSHPPIEEQHSNTECDGLNQSQLSPEDGDDKRGLVLGVYTSDGKDDITLTPYAKKYNESTSGELLKQISIGGPIKGGSSRIFWGVGPFPAVAVAGLGDASSWSELDEINGIKENIRIAAAAGAKALLSEKVTNIFVEDLNCAQSAAEGATLGVFKYQGQKSQSKRSPTATVNLADGANGASEWNKGFILANTQNWSRTLMDMPANLMTPTIFAENIKEKCVPLGIGVDAHNREWAAQQGMGSYLSVARGSEEPPIFLELTYNGASSDKKPVCFVGKGITFDSGGISLKPSSKMDEMRADMGGAAVVAGLISALAELKIPVNAKGLIPLTENMPSGTATKPGDVVFAMNGKSICVDNTDAEGRLVLCNALCYSDKFNPKYVLDIATLTGAIKVALGDCVSGAFCNRNELWAHLHRAGSETGDRMWRMPLFKHYTSQMTDHNAYDLNNLGKGNGAGSCVAAAFLREFVPKDTPWIHIDMAGVMGNCTDQTYTGSKGMTGLPMRTLFEFVCMEAGFYRK